MPHLDADEARIFYEDHGGNGASVVLSHGFLMDHEMFQPQVEALASEFRCITWDQRGHGLTKSEGPFSYWDSAGDLIALLDHLGLAHACLAGVSQGGYVSLRTALLAPARVQTLVLIDSQAGAEDPALAPIYEQLLQHWTTEGPSREIAEMVAPVIVAPADPSPWIEKWSTRPAEAVLYPCRALMDREDISDRIAEITCPALVIHGEDDPAIAVDRGERLCKLLPRCDGFIRIPQAGHAVNLSHPGVVNEAVRDFLHRHTG